MINVHTPASRSQKHLTFVYAVFRLGLNLGLINKKASQIERLSHKK